MKPERCFLWGQPQLKIKCKGLRWWLMTEQHNLWKWVWEMATRPVGLRWTYLEAVHSHNTGYTLWFPVFFFLETVLAVVPVSICWWASKVKPFLILMTNGLVEIWATVFRCTTQGKWHFKPIKRSAAQLWEYPSVFLCHVKTTTRSFMHPLALTHLHTPTWHMILMWETRFPPILPISSVWTDRTKSPGLDSDSLTRKVPGSSFALRSFSAFGPDRWPWYHLGQKIKHWWLMMQPLWHMTCRTTGN